MFINKNKSRRKLLLYFICLSSSLLFICYYSIINIFQPFIPKVRIRPERKDPFKKIFISHYTTTYGKRTDSKSKLFSNNLENICALLDPEEYPYANAVFVSLIDLVHLPTLPNTNESYRKKYQSQFWLLHTEESPRKSYETVQLNDITDLDDWFNLTATLKPESDIHIQYKGYRIKPEIISFLEKKLNKTYPRTNFSQFILKQDFFEKTNSSYMKTLANVLSHEINLRQDHYANACPYTCNTPLSNDLTVYLQPYLKPRNFQMKNRNIVYIAWFVSNCNTHSNREEYVSKLRSQKGIQIDVFGFCSSFFNSRRVSERCRKGIPNCTLDILTKYRFYLSFENSKCDTYITEKYWINGLNQHAVPIVLGASREQYKRIGVPYSYIHVDDYQSVEQLAEELHRLNQNDSEYMKYLQWTQLYDVGSDYMPTILYDIHSTLCFLGHYQRLYEMGKVNQESKYLLELIRYLFSIKNMTLKNFNWDTATTKIIKISDFYNPKVNCWDYDYPSIFKRIWNFFSIWTKLF
ncbi:unnamed protein product [Adineta ricciae]|uniref:Fucosyltransferase n=3 Tax=Adineta ricciae TaxID=249248 RepID=A0A815N2Z6_ADIRI|nr:unnamed protein product [Adineta ricciae]